MNWTIETNHVFCDVDGTLLIWPTKPGSPRPGEVPQVNRRLVTEIKRWQQRSNGILVIWSRRGLEHARMAMNLCGLDAVCVAKPDIMIDDADPMTFRKATLLCTPQQFCE